MGGGKTTHHCPGQKVGPGNCRYQNPPGYCTSHQTKCLKKDHDQVHLLTEECEKCAYPRIKAERAAQKEAEKRRVQELAKKKQEKIENKENIKAEKNVLKDAERKKRIEARAQAANGQAGNSQAGSSTQSGNSTQAANAQVTNAY